MSILRTKWIGPLIVLHLMAPLALTEEGAQLASPVLPILQTEKPDLDMEMEAQKPQILIRRDNESLSCAERFQATPPNCFDETQPIYVENPVGNSCDRGYTQSLADAGQCESPCECVDVPKASQNYSRGKKSIVTCTHPKTQWKCRKVSSNEE